jgi:hypothetical protein
MCLCSLTTLARPVRDAFGAATGTAIHISGPDPNGHDVLGAPRAADLTN